MEKIAKRYYEIPKDKRNGKCQITVSTSFFVPKPFTPFQWARMCTKEEFLDKAYIVNSEIKAQLNKKSIKYNWHEADVTVLEGILAAATAGWARPFWLLTGTAVSLIPGASASIMTGGFRPLKRPDWMCRSILPDIVMKMSCPLGLHRHRRYEKIPAAGVEAGSRGDRNPQLPSAVPGLRRGQLPCRLLSHSAYRR